MTEAAAAAARNNAEWCDVIAAAHGSAGRFEAGFWINPGSAPPFYPNLVTLDPVAADTQRAAIARLAATRPAGFGIKDSFARLDLSDLGFDVAFTADWILLRTETALSSVEPDLEVTAAAGPEGLSTWERAWRGGDGQTLFPAALLRDDRLAFLSIVRGGEIVAGAVLNQSAAVLGLSNVFIDPMSNARACLAALIAKARALYPDLPIVGYERGDALPPFLDLGFERIGPLRIWLKS